MMIASRSYCKSYFDPLPSGMDITLRLRSLIDRIARLDAAEDWSHGLNPTQAAALAYLLQANRFSRAPSHVAEYLANTRGTVSQTLKALARKGLVVEAAKDGDRRRIRYDVTMDGEARGLKDRALNKALRGLPSDEASRLDDMLSDTLRAVLAARSDRTFGICRTCTHHDLRDIGGYCRLLRVDLAPEERGQICHEHQPPVAA